MSDLKRTHEADVLLLYVILLNADSRTINWSAVAEATGITQSAARLKWYRLKQELDLKIEAGGFDYRDMRVAEAQSGSDGDKDAGGFSMKVTTATAATTAAEEDEPRSDGKPKEQQQSQLKRERKKKSSKIVQDAESVLFSDSSSAGSDGDVDEDDWIDGTRGGRRKSFVFYAGGRGDKLGEIKSDGGVDVSETKERELKVMGSQERVSCWSSDSSLVKVGISGDGSQGEACAIYSDEDHGGDMEVKGGEKAGDFAATQENDIDKVKEGAVE
ncbi:hypothetical protein ASPACDRAFT_62811 [Aspergillus aculeatus ATCC 16872]|uniref:Myb-like DNA-binding domain-containing protein n=1 Tax=Aspergillus aculeatus (strain ATCC 16872 / CBS 172.66 / WB 5094) TaxID=690307 RepID=A0A1L9WLS5_ASPA1|nr:uncharacterized protein ASPACDRAFT_62811 [Aspergillus aculeatus ATCC 16872]OJJ97104.1 hypothetical protein ASPACDRAFT_62811 [Aspergillus aculeatus ATCC 16872]